MTAITPADARESFPCPVARTFATKIGPNCDAESCIAWRWVPLSADNPALKAAISKAAHDMAAEAGKAGSAVMYHQKAVRHVMDNRADLGLPTKPTHGFCGLAGAPEA